MDPGDAQNRRQAPAAPAQARCRRANIDELERQSCEEIFLAREREY
jgi:hypothetical protein